MRRAVLMMRQAISPRLAIRIVLNIAPLRESAKLSLNGVFLLERGKRVNNCARPSASLIGRRPVRGERLSGADFDLSPSVLKPGAGEVAAVCRLERRPSERRPGPRISAEGREARGGHPFDPFGWIGVRLSFRRARLRKDPDRQERRRRARLQLWPCRDAPRTRRASRDAPALFDTARDRRPQGGFAGQGDRPGKAIARLRGAPPRRGANRLRRRAP